MQNSSTQGIQFRSNIRSYNSAFSFASFHATFCDFKYKGPPLLKIHGQVYHMGTSSLHTDHNQEMDKFIYNDGHTALQLRSNCGSTDPDIMINIEKLLRNINPYAKLYKTLHEKYEDSDANKEFTLNFVRFNCDDKRIYNKPITGEIAAIIISKDGAVPKNIDFRIFPKHHREFEIMPKTSQHVNAMTFPLSYPSGDLGWGYEMKQMKENNITITV